MTELELFYRCIPDIAEITVDLRKRHQSIRSSLKVSAWSMQVV